MGSSTNKGNISTAMAILSLLVLVVVVAVLADLMISNDSRAGKYINPNVASQVVRGTIYDRNGRALAMEVPKNNLYLRTKAENFDISSQLLSIYLDLTPDAIAAKTATSTTELTLIQSDISTELMDEIKAAAAKNGVSSDIVLVKEYSRTFPAAFHAAQLIEETERVFDNVLSPAPGYDQSTTYGNNVYLSVDLDIQYLLDLAVQQVYEVQQPEYCVAFILDVTNAQIVASTTYPFYDLNDSANISEGQKVNRTLVSSIVRPDIRVSDISVVCKVTDYNATTEISEYTTASDYTRDLEVIKSMARGIDYENSAMEKIPAEHPKYLVLVGSVGAKYYVGSAVFEYAITSIEEGLAAQNKL